MSKILKAQLGMFLYHPSDGNAEMKSESLDE